MTLRLEDEAAASISFFVPGTAEELALAVMLRPVAPAWAKALAVVVPMLRFAPMMATTKVECNFWVEGARNVGWVLLSLVVKLSTVRAGAAIFVV